MDIQSILNQLLMRQNQQPQQPAQNKEKNEIFKYHPIVLPNNLSNFEQNISNNLQKIFKCKECFNFENDLKSQICDSCQQVMAELQQIMFFGIFEKEKHFPELSAFWKTGGDIKVYCGKILRASDVGYKCYDCEMDPTCIICKECFEKGDHRGHRTVIQKGCSGCCDCGDIEAWKKEGFCKDHKGFLTEEQLNINQIDKKYRDNIIKGFKFLFYCLFSQIEDLLQHTKNGQQIQVLQSNLAVQKVLEYTIMLIEKIVLKNPVLQNLFNHILCEQKFEEDRFKFKHCCADIISRVTIGNEKTHPLQKCQCTILELMLRYVVSYNSQVQEKVKNFYISMFNLYHFKQNLIKAYTKMFNFFYFFKNKNDSDSHPFISNFTDLNVQLFTSDILAGYVLDQKTDNYIIEYFISKNSGQQSRKGSLNVQKNTEDSKRKLSENLNQKANSRKNSEKAALQKELQEVANQTIQQNNRLEVEEEAEEEEVKNNIENEIVLEEVEVIRPQQQQQERDEDFETEEEEDVYNDEEYEDEEEYDSQDMSGSEMYIDSFEEQIDESLPLFDDKEQQKDVNKIQSCVNEYYFGNVFDRLLLFCTYSFKQKSVIEQFFKTFQHIKYISQKEFSLSKLVDKDFFRIKYIELLSKLHYKIDHKLKRKFETLYEKDEFYLNGVDCEKVILSVLRKIVCYLHTQKSITELAFSKFHIDYMKLIMKKILETTEKYDKQLLSDVSSIHIPLHRALIMLIMSYFKFNFENMTPQALNQLARSLNLELEDFNGFFLDQLKYPLHVISFIKEIDCGVWNNEGEQFKYLSSIYISQDFGFQYYDTLFFQFVLKIGNIDLKQISKLFCSKKEFYDITNLKLVKKNYNDNKDFLEKNEKVLGEFISFVNYSLLDTVSLFNLIQSIFHNNTSDQINHYLKYSNAFVASYMHQFKAASIQEVSESLVKTFGKYLDVSTFLVQVCSFQNSTKKFTLLEKFNNICEPNLFYWSPIIKSVFHDKMFQKYQNSKDIHIYLLGNAEFTQTQRGSLKNVINVNSFKFIEDLIRQPFISNQLEAKKSIPQQHLLTPILKLIFLFTQNRSNLQNSEQIETHANNILTFLIQFKDHFGKEMLDTIQYLQEKLTQSNKLTMQKAQSVEDSDEANKKKKQMIQQKQQEILKLFQQRSQTYSEKNKDDLVLEKSTSDGDNCVICKKSLDEEAEFGYGIYCQKTNIFEFSELKGYAQQNIDEADQTQFIKTESTKNDYWNIKEGNWQINSCFHHTHKSCYQQYLYTTNKQRQQGGLMKQQYYYDHEYKCPLCNKLLNSFLTIVPNQTVKTLEQNFAISDSSYKMNQAQFEWISLQVDSSTTKQNDEDPEKYEQYLYRQEISQIISEYETMNKKRRSEMNQSSHEVEIKYKKYVQPETTTLTKDVDHHFLLSQIEVINCMQYDTDIKKNTSKIEIENESSDDLAITRIENIVLTHLRMTDFDSSPTALVQQQKKLSLLRQILYNLNSTLSQTKVQDFYQTRYNYCQDVLKLLTGIQISTKSQLQKNLLENDLKEMYLKFLFYSINYFNDETQFIQIIQKTMIQVLLAKFVQIHLVQMRKKNCQKIVLEEINTFNDNEACQFNVDILQRTWNLLSLFFNLDLEVNLSLNQIFYDSKEEVNCLLKFMNLTIPSEVEQREFLSKCIAHSFDQNNTNILKIKPINTSFTFVPLEYKYDDLFKKYQRATCSLCKDISKYRDGNLSMCLICGDIICSISCKEFDTITFKNHVGNLNKHAKQMHCNSSLFLDLTTSQVICVSYPNNGPIQELYINSFGIPFKKSAKDWSQFQLDNGFLSNLHLNVTNLTIIDAIKVQQIKTNMLYRYQYY